MFRQIQTELWTDPKVRRLTVFEKLLFVYCLTNPHTHLCGLYYIPKEVMRLETGLGRGIDGAFMGLQRTCLIEWDEELCQLWVINMFRYQGRGQKTERGVAYYLTGLHPSVLIQRFLQRYPQVTPYLPASFKGCPIDAPSMGVPDFPSPIPIPSEQDPLSSSSLVPNLKSTHHAPKSHQTWVAYAASYKVRYGVEPVRNATINSCLCRLVDRIGAEAPDVAAFYVTHTNSFYVAKGHPVNLLVADAEKLRTEWATKTVMTQTQARQEDQRSAKGQMWNRLISKAESNKKEA